MRLATVAISSTLTKLMSVTAVSAQSLRLVKNSANQIPPRSTQVPPAGQPDSSLPSTATRRATPAATAAMSTPTLTGAPTLVRQRRFRPKSSLSPL